jgi:hypothetical protein
MSTETRATSQWWMLRGSPPNLHLFTEHEDPIEDLTGNRPRTASVYARENQTPSTSSMCALLV